MLIKIKRGGFCLQLINILAYLSILYVLFMLLWGFNYERLSLDKITKLKIESSSKEQLYDLCNKLINRTNTLRELVPENSEGIATSKGDYRNIFIRAEGGYTKLSELYPEFSGNYGIPKPVFLSEALCYTGITGMYFPYTGEANVNIKIESFMLPFTVSHEMAHQRGFAKEDEANYIAYLTCSINPDLDFKYSGELFALIYSMNAMYQTDSTYFQKLEKGYSVKVKRDIIYHQYFWEKYQGKVQNISDAVNNQYLKSNGQKDGIQSYGRMVDFLLAQFKKSGSV